MAGRNYIPVDELRRRPSIDEHHRRFSPELQQFKGCNYIPADELRRRPSIEEHHRRFSPELQIIEDRNYISIDELRRRPSIEEHHRRFSPELQIIEDRNYIPSDELRRRASIEEHHRRFSPELQLIEDQNLKIRTLLHDNQRLATSYVPLKKELAAAEQDIIHLSATAESVKAEREAQVRQLYDRLRQLDAEANAIEGIPAELEQVREDIKKVRSDQKKLVDQLQDIDSDLKRTHLELEQLPALKAEIETMKKEIHRGRAAIEFERKMRDKNLELSEAMEKHKALLFREAQNLRLELADAEKKAMAAAAVTAANPGHVYGYTAHPQIPGNGYAGNSLHGPYAVDQGNIVPSFQYGHEALHVPAGPYVVQEQQILN